MTKINHQGHQEGTKNTNVMIGSLGVLGGYFGALGGKALESARAQKFSATGSKWAWGCWHTGQALGAVVPSWMWPQTMQRQ